jgi:hypothetical protein
LVTFTATVTGGSGSNVAPTGTVDIYRDWEDMVSISLAPSGPNTSTGTYSLPNTGSTYFFGSNQITAVYGGDTTYRGSVSAPVQLNVISTTVTPDFILAPQINQLTVQSGSSATEAINLAAQNEFSGAVTLSCTPSSSQITCSVNRASVTLHGAATSTLTITVAGKAAELAAPRQNGPAKWPVDAGMLAVCLFLAGGRAHRRLRRSMLLSLCLLAAMLTISCSGGNGGNGGGTGGGRGGGGGGGGTTPPAVLVTYRVVVTGTANGIAHNAKITVVVP